MILTISRSLITKIVMAFSFLSASLSAQDTVQQAADMVIYGGTIYTADDNQPSAEFVAVKDGRIQYVGSREGGAAFTGPDTTVIQLSGAWLYPGFTDAHVHLRGVGERALTLNLDQVSSVQNLQSTLKNWANLHDHKVIVGRGWIETHWPEKRFPSRWDIDAVVSDRPVILSRSDGHAVVVNSAALKAAGITGETQAPFGGEILKNALGEPTGILVDTARNLVASLIPTATVDQRQAALIKGSEVYTSRGWTSVHDMSVLWADHLALEELSDAGEATIRSYSSIDMGAAGNLFASGPRINQNGKIIAKAIKMYMDGALGSRGAALLAPYSDADTVGLVQMQESPAKAIMLQALTQGIQINTHAIGDRGNRLVLDWYQDIFNDASIDHETNDLRWRIEHAQIVHPDDIPRFKALSVIPSMQPSHAIGDMFFAPDRLGADRLTGAYAWQSLIDSGVIIAGGSDAPVEQGQPMIEFYAATVRRSLDGFADENWHAEEAVSRANALKMFTLWPAMAAFQEDNLGSITVGKLADFTAFDIDLMTAAPAAILKGKAVLTIIGGEIVYSEGGLQ